jgi:MFS family permease
VRLAAALALMTIGAAPMYGSIMILGPLAQEFGVSRGLASLPYMLFMIGFGLGGVAIGRLTDRLGIMLPALLSAFVLSGGLVLAARAGGV